MADAIFQGKVEEERSRGRPGRQWLDDVEEWTGPSLNGMWREPDDRVVWIKRVSRVASQTEFSMAVKIPD